LREKNHFKSPFHVKDLLEVILLILYFIKYGN